MGVVYHLFAHWVNSWMKVNMPNRKKLSKRDIVTQMKELGFELIRGQFRNDRKETFGLRFEQVRQYMQKHYGKAIEPWWHDVHREDTKQLLNIHN